MDPARLSVSNLGKSFATPVLSDVGLSILPGEIHGLVGENGAGKTTLLNVIAGLLRPDTGIMHLDGKAYAPESPRDARNAGIAYASQEPGVIDTLSVAENISLHALPNRLSVIRTGELHRRARAAMRLVGLEHCAPETPAGDHSVADRQLMDLARALSSDSRVLLLDEPTAALTAARAERLHGLITAKARAGIAVVYVSHRLHDVLALADRVSVLRDGRVISTAAGTDTSVAQVMQIMGGRSTATGTPRQTGARTARAALVVDAITTRALPHAISFTCNEGEILGIAGLAGSGRSALLKALFGLTRLTGGRVLRHTAEGEAPVTSPAGAVRCGIGYVGEDRRTMGVFDGLSVAENLVLPGLSRRASAFGRIDRKNVEAATARRIDELGIRCRGPRQDIGQLSGGNQQKVLLARWLDCDSDVFLLDEPMRGIDIGAKNTLFALLRKLRDAGKSVVMVSSEIEELTDVCDRILVMSGRRLVQSFERGTFSEAGILDAAFSAFTASHDGDHVKHARDRP